MIGLKTMHMKRIAIFALALTVIAAAVFAIYATNTETQAITGRCLVTINGIYLIVDKNDEPIVMHNQSGNESLFHGLNNGDMIGLTCDLILATYPGTTNVTKCKLIAKGSLDDIPENTISILQEMGWRFEEEP